LKPLKTQNRTHQTCRHAYAQPDLGEADDHNPGEVAPLRLADESSEVPIYSVNTSEIQGSRPQAPLPVVRRAAQQLEDVSAISFEARAALTPDEARMRVLVQASVNEFGVGFMIMALTPLDALLKLGREAAGSERAHALSAIQNKYVYIGVFDCSGRCLLGRDVSGVDPALGK